MILEKERRPRSPQLSPWLLFLFLLLSTAPFFVNLEATLWGSEGRWLSVSSEMARSGDYFRPVLHGDPYDDKPLLSYWAIVLASLPFGHIDERVSRLPSAVAGAITVFLTAWIGARVFGRRSGALAGWILATSYSFYFWSRSASADLLNLTFTLAAITVYLESTLQFKPWKPVIFFLLLALGGQSKGMPAVIVPTGVAISDFLLRELGSFRRAEATGLLAFARHAAQRALERLPWLALGLVMGTALYVLPFILSYFERHDWELLALVWKENFVRAFRAFDHRAPVYYYFLTLPGMFLPWSPWLVGAVGWGGRRFRTHSGFRFSLLAFVVIFLLFSASESRRSYYILPIFPFASLLVAAFLDEMLLLHRSRVPLGAIWRAFLEIPLWSWGALLGAGALFFLAGPLLPAPMSELWQALPYRGLCAAASAASFLGLSWAFLRRDLRGQIAFVALSAFLGALYYVTGVEALRETSRVEPLFAREMKARFPGLDFVYFKPNARLRYYLGAGRQASSPREFQALIGKEKGEIFVVSHVENIPSLEKMPWEEIAEVLTVSAPALGPLKPQNSYSLLRARRGEKGRE